MDTISSPESNSPRDRAIARPPVISEPIDGVSVDVTPYEIVIPLRPDPDRFEDKRAGSYWHRVHRFQHVTVRIQNTSDRVRLLHIQVTCASPGWNSKWVRWSFARRRLPADYSGDAIAAQDQLSEDDSELFFLLLPGDDRVASLEFRPFLDEVTLAGNYAFTVTAVDSDEPGRQSRSVGTLKVRHPTPAMLSYLPAIYHSSAEEMPESIIGYSETPFFERFLQGFEDSLDPSRALLDSIYRFFDVDEAPSEFVPWLAVWVGLTLDQNWPELRRRQLIREAVELYRWRGTRRGLARYLQIYTGVSPTIDDRPFEGMRLGPSAILGANTILGDVPPHTFVVTVAVPDRSTINDQIIRDIIESEKPAHTAYDLRILEHSISTDAGARAIH